jgi:hypothetical protein
VIKIFATLDGARAPLDDHVPPRSLRFSTLVFFNKQISFFLVFQIFDNMEYNHRLVN